MLDLPRSGERVYVWPKVQDGGMPISDGGRWAAHFEGAMLKLQGLAARLRIHASPDSVFRCCAAGAWGAGTGIAEARNRLAWRFQTLSQDSCC
jgi:hypothetical protein